jgi:hypothetical protein
MTLPCAKLPCEPSPVDGTPISVHPDEKPQSRRSEGMVRAQQLSPEPDNSPEPGNSPLLKRGTTQPPGSRALPGKWVLQGGLLASCSRIIHHDAPSCCIIRTHLTQNLQTRDCASFQNSPPPTPSQPFVSTIVPIGKRPGGLAETFPEPGFHRQVLVESTPANRLHRTRYRAGSGSFRRTRT